MRTKLLRRLRNKANERYSVIDCVVCDYNESGTFIKAVIFQYAPLSIYCPREFGKRIILSCNENLPRYEKPESLKTEWWKDRIVEMKRDCIVRNVMALRGKGYRYREKAAERLNKATKI